MMNELYAALVQMGLAVLVLISGLGASSAWGQTTATLEKPGQLSAWQDKPLLTPEQEEWLRATPEERVKITEQIGEQGARSYAHQQGWKPIYNGNGRQLPQGLDQVYYDPKTGKTIVVEAKGGTSQLGRGYGYEQGTPEWAVKSAENVLHSNGASAAERQAAEKVIEAARKGNLEVHTVRTEHKLGKPTGAKVEQVARCTPKAQQLAQEVATRYGIGKSFQGASEGRSAGMEGTTGPMEQKGPNGTQEGGSTSAIKGGVKPATRQVNKATARLSEAGQSARNAGSSTAKSISRAASREAASEAALSTRAASGGSSTVKTLGKVGGALAIGIDAGIRLYDVYQIEEAYRRGEISNHERWKAHAKNGAGALGGYGGGYAGSCGGWAAGAAIGTAICPGIGTAIGGAIGGIAGAIGGYWAGEKAAEAVVDYAMGP